MSIIKGVRDEVLVLGGLLLASQMTKSKPVLAQPSAPVSTKLTLPMLRALAFEVGFPDPDLAAAVAMAESGGDVHAKNISSREQSYGLWQVNILAHPQYAADALQDPLQNAQAAYELSAAGQNWAPWAAYTTTNPALSYKRYMPPPQLTP